MVLDIWPDSCSECYGALLVISEKYFKIFSQFQIAAASRITGVTPAALVTLLRHVKTHGKSVRKKI